MLRGGLSRRNYEIAQPDSHFFFCACRKKSRIFLVPVFRPTRGSRMHGQRPHGNSLRRSGRTSIRAAGFRRRATTRSDRRGISLTRIDRAIREIAYDNAAFIRAVDGDPQTEESAEDIVVQARDFHLPCITALAVVAGTMKRDEVAIVGQPHAYAGSWHRRASPGQLAGAFARFQFARRTRGPDATHR